jgi:hypothetical protein
MVEVIGAYQTKGIASIWVKVPPSDHDSGTNPRSHSLVFITNQGIKPAALKTWKEKVPLIGQAVSNFYMSPYLHNIKQTLLPHS